MATGLEPHELDHGHDDDPEALMGAEILDPWSDPTQLDWPNNTEDEEEN